MALFETQEPLRLDAERAYAMARARLEQRPPYTGGVFRRQVDLESEFADETDAHDPARRAGHQPLADAKIRNAAAPSSSAVNSPSTTRARGPARLNAA